MLAEFKHTIRRLRGQSIGWGIGVALYGLMMVSMYDTVAKMAGLEDLIKSYPPEMMVFFGDMQAIATPSGYLDIYYFSYMTLIIGIFAVSACAALLVGDEEKGILDLVMAHPISRAALFWGRLLSMVTMLVVVLLLGWLSWAIPSGSSGMGLSWIEFLWPFLPLFAELMLFGTLALLLSMILPTARLAAMLSGALLVGNFLLLGLSNMNSSLDAVVRFTPLFYYQGGSAVAGVNWTWFLALLAVSVLFSVLAWWRFTNRDIRTAGEAGWQLPALRRPFPRRKAGKQEA